jgi:hypothetical protein
MHRALYFVRLFIVQRISGVLALLLLLSICMAVGAAQLR